MNLFKKYANEYSIFKNESVFLPDYLPEVIGREKEIKELVLNLEPIIKNKQPISTLLYGPPGTGKTTLAKYVTKELKEAKNDLSVVYVNCWEEGSRYAILTAIAKALGYVVARRGKAVDEIIQYISEFSKKYIVLILDEVDTLQEKSKVLYDLLRMKENYGINIVLISIANTLRFVNNIEDRVKSSFLSSSISFKPYKPNELKNILKERAKLGLLPGSYSKEVINLAAGIASKYGGDARLAINLLWLAAKECDKKGKSFLDVEDIKSVKEKALLFLLEEKEKFLSPEEKKILKIIREEKMIKSGELYEKLKNMNDRTIRNYLKKLEEKDLIIAIQSSAKEGNTRFFVPK